MSSQRLFNPCICCVTSNQYSPEFIQTLRAQPLKSPEDYDRYCALYSSRPAAFGALLRGISALGSVAELGNRVLVRHIVQKEGDQLLRVGDYMGRTPLHVAAAMGQGRSLETVKELLALGANPSMTDRCGQTVLDASRTSSVARLLLRRGAAALKCATPHVERAKQQLQEERLMLAARFKNPGSFLSRIPLELFKVVHGYVLSN